MQYIFYPPPSVQGSVPPQVKVPIAEVPPPSDNPPLTTDVYQYVIASLWQPGPFYEGNVQRELFPIAAGDSTNDNPFFRREESINRINLSWYTPYIPYTAYQGKGPIAPFLRSPDNPPFHLLQYPSTIYTQYEDISNWKIIKHRPIKDIFFTPGVLPPPIPASFQVNVNIYSVRHSLDIEINNNLSIQNVNQGSTFLFTIHSFNRKGFPRVINSADAVSLSLKDSLGNLVFAGQPTTKLNNIFTYIYQLDNNAPLGPWSVQAVASFKDVNLITDIRVTPYAICFTVI